MIILGIPTSFTRGVCEEPSKFIDKDTIVVNTAKGLENKTLKTMSTVTEESFFLIIKLQSLPDRLMLKNWQEEFRQL